ncbi:MAG TPA: insulinase family protein, partial [Longimicrobiales bacterium]
EMGLDIQADALKHSQIDEDELARELLVIIQEAKRKLDNPSAVATETLYEEMFDAHPIRRWRIGTEEGLRRLRRQDIWEYYRNLYRPSNIVLVVAGDVDPGRTLELIERHYGEMAPGEPVREPRPDELPRREFRLREIDGEVVHTYVELGWRTPETAHPDTAVLDLLSGILGQGRASRLYRGVRELGLATSIGAYNYTPTELGVFGISAEMQPGDTLGALEAIAREVESVRSAPASSRELERAKNLLEARLLRRLETAEGQATQLAHWQAMGDWRLAEDYQRRLLAATAEDVHRVAREYLDLDAATVLVYRPRSAPALGLGAADLRERLVAASATAEPVRIVEATGEPAARGLGRPLPVGSEDGVAFFELPDGTRLGVKPRTAAPLVSMAVWFRGGELRESAELAGITALLGRVSVKGTATRTAEELAEATESLGGSISPSVGADSLGWSLSLPARHFARGFELLADVVLRPALPEPELERERRIMLADLEHIRDDTYQYPMQLLLQA